MAMQGRIWTVPNQITFLRLGFLPFYLILMSYEKYRWALLVLVVAGFSDKDDGHGGAGIVGVRGDTVTEYHQQ